MDKETLSNYGWIVICVLILAVMLALATPFGNFIAGAFKATYAGFGMVGDNALGIVIPGAGDGENDGNTGDVPKDTMTVNVPGLGEIDVDNPDVEITYDPDTGDAGGIVPPSNDEADEPFDIPEEELPETITVNYGKFESTTKYTPGEYATVEYVENVITIKQPVDNDTYSMAWWHIVKDSDGNILSTTADAPSLSRLPNAYEGATFSNYIVYSLDDTSTSAMNGVDSNTIWFASIANRADDTLDNAIYLAAVAQKQQGFDVHIAKWNGTQYADQGKDTEIDAVNSFTKTTPVTKTKQVLVSAPTSTTTHTYVPAGTLVAEKDMTWAEWLASDYNTTGETAPTIKTADFEDVSYDDLIVEGDRYGFMRQQNIAGATFSDGVTLTWDELKLAENGTKYGYKASAITDTIIDYDAFRNCTSLTSINIPEGVTLIGEDAFAYCTALESITLPSTLTTIFNNSFSNCTSLTSITIPSGVTTFEGSVFYKCTALESITLPSTLTDIDQNAFYYCTSLMSITFEGTKAQWNAISKGTRWNYKVPATEVICSDGTVSLS